MKKLIDADNKSYVLDTIKDLGIEGEVKGDEFVCLCLFHNDSEPSMYINLVSGVFYCFGCSESGNLQKLYKYIKGEDVELQRTPEVLISVKGDHVRNIVSKALSKDKKLVVRKKAIIRLTEENMIQSYYYFINRGIPSLDILELFAIRDGIGKFADRTVMPVRDMKGKVLSLSARATYDVGKKGLKVVKVKGSKANNTLYGMYELIVLKKYVGDYLILVEGEIDAVSGQYCGYPTVACTKKAVTDKQLALMSPYKIILVLDSDVGQSGYNKMMGKITKVTDVRKLKMKKYEDLNGALMGGGKDAVDEQLCNYKKLF